jgi:hypothetical protein
MSTPSTDIESFYLKQEVFETSVKPRLYKISFLTGIVTVGTILVLTFFLNKNSEFLKNTPVSISVNFLVVVAVVLGLAISLRKQIKRERMAWKSFQLTLGKHVVRRYMANVPAIEILRSEVTTIIDSQEGLTIKTANPYHFLFVPKSIVAYEAVRERLVTWKTFEVISKSKQIQSVVKTSTFAIAVIGSWIATGRIQDIRLAMLPGTILWILCLWSISAIRKIEGCNSKQKAIMMGTAVFMMLAPLGRLALYFMMKEIVEIQ